MKITSVSFCEFVAGLFQFSSIDIQTDRSGLKAMLDTLENWQLTGYDQTSEAKRFSFYVIDIFRTHFYLPSLKRKGDQIQEISRHFSNAKNEFHKKIKKLAQSSDEHDVDIMQFYFSGHMNTTLQKIRQWFNLILRCHYLVTYYEEHQQNKVISSSIPIFRGEILQYVGKWIEFVCEDFLPFKLKQNSRVEMDYNPNRQFSACCWQDFNRIQSDDSVHSNGSSFQWNPFASERNIPKFSTQVMTLLVKPTSFSRNYKERIQKLMRIQINKKDSMMLSIFTKDLYDLGTTRVSHFLINELIQMYSKLVIRDTIYNSIQAHEIHELIKELVKHCDFDALVTFKRCVEIGSLEGMRRITGPGSSEFIEKLMGLVGTQREPEDGLHELIRKCYLLPGPSKVLDFDPIEVDKSPKLWRIGKSGKMLITRGIYMEFVIDLCRYSALVQGFDHHDTFIGFLRFLSIHLLQESRALGGRIEKSHEDKHLLLVDQKDLSEYNGLVVKGLYYRIVDAIRFIQSLNTAFPGVRACNEFIETFNDQCTRIKNISLQMTKLPTDDLRGDFLQEICDIKL